MLNNFQKSFRNFVIRVGNGKLIHSDLNNIVHNDFYHFKSMYGKILFSSYREHTLGDIVNEFAIPRKYITKFAKNRYSIDCEAYVRGGKMLEDRIDKLEERLDKNEKILQDIYDKLCVKEEPVREYSPEKLVEVIMNIGRSIYSIHEDVDFAIELIRLGLDDEYLPIIREKDRIICLGFNENSPDMVDRISKKLGIVQSMFTLVTCGPECTVVLIDCEKQHLRAKNYKIGVGEWLIH